MSLQVITAAKDGGGTKKAGASKWGSKIKVTKTIKGPKTEIKLSPSSYLAEMKLNTEEKLEKTCEMYPPKIIELLDMGTASHHKETNLSVDQAIFQPFPSEIIFQQFEPQQAYEFPLQLRNLDTVGRHIKVTGEESPYFSIACQHPIGGKVAPGMEVTYNITFKPDEKKDYDHELICITEREKFVVPVKAIGSRALLDFPDQINFSGAPVKYCSVKTVLMRNIGNAEAKFTMDVDKPYSVTPSTATLAVNSCMQVNISYIPLELGEHSAELVIHYNTGEKVYTKLYGSANDVNVRLERSTLSLDNTFIGLSSKRCVLLHNRSHVVVQYQWKTFSSEEEEEAQREILSEQLMKEEKISKETFYQRYIHNPTIRDRLPILTRTLDLNRKKYTNDEQFLFFDQCLVIDPLEGEIWPNSQAEISVIFCPNSHGTFSRVAYCDVVGRESRLPLKIKGEGIGPQCHFSFDTLDIQSVFVNSAHAYEVFMENKGDIEATYSLVQPTSLFGPNFTFAPSTGTVQPGQLQAIQISFCSRELGEFNEEFHWEIKDGPHPLILRIKGVVIGPTFRFDCAKIKFGTISCGFTATKELTLSNTSEIPMTFHFKVPVNAKEEEEGDITSTLPVNSEFTVVPQTATLPPNFQQLIKLSLTPLSVTTYSTMLVMELQETGKNTFSLPISAKSVVPHITLLTPLLNYGRCFLDHPYILNTELCNSSNFPVKYKVLSQMDKTLLTYSTAQPSGTILPHTTLKLPLEILAKITGEISTTVPIKILGSTDPPIRVAIYCIGEGPVIYITPDVVQWKVCPVLTAVSKKVTVSNQSLIPAKFECALANDKSIFSVEPLSAVVPPEQSLKLTITAVIDDAVKFTDKLNILVSQGVNFTVSLSGEGKGSTIVSDPPLYPSVDLGTFFSQRPCQKQFTLTNKGRRIQALSWTTEGFSVSKMKKAEMDEKSRDLRDVGIKQQVPQKDPEIKKPIFQIIPDKCVLEPLQSCVITLKGYSRIPRVVNERIICHSIIGKTPYKERIMTVDITASFINPLLQFSSKEVVYHIEQPPGSKLIHHTQQLGVRNVSQLPVTAVYSCPYPFCLLKEEVALAKMDMLLGPGEQSEITILYDSTYCKDKHTRFEHEYLTVSYREHPQQDQIALKSEVHFPNVNFDKTEIDFGCILNDTEALKHTTMTNTSPLPVTYHWFFITRPPVVRQEPDLLDEGIDMESDYNSMEEFSCEDMIEESDESEEEVVEEEEEEVVVDEEDEDGELITVKSSPCIEVKNEVNNTAKFRSMLGSYSEPMIRDSSSGYFNSQLLPKVQVMITNESGDGSSEGFSNKNLFQNVEPESDQPIILLENSTTQPKQLGKKRKKKKKKRKKAPWKLAIDLFKPIPITQVFDILPLHGELEPGASTTVQFEFYGHLDITADVVAACKVEGGPTYEIRLNGSASKMCYKLSRKELDLGTILYNQVHVTEMVLYNRGKVDFSFCTLNVKEDPRTIVPGEITVSPSQGHISALDSIILTVTFLPGLPEIFSKSFEIRVAHFEVDEIRLVGEATFPKMDLNLPRDISAIPMETQDIVRSNLGLPSSLQQGGESDTGMDYNMSRQLEEEIDRLIVNEFAIENADKLFTEKGSAKPKVSLPEFFLDFGHVVFGLMATRSVSLVNNGHTPISFTLPYSSLEGSGFSMDLMERVKAFPPGVELNFNVIFDPASINQKEGESTRILPFNLLGGPQYRLRLRGEVTRPNMDISDTCLEFGTVLCGQCKIITIRLSNPYLVECDWTTITKKPPKELPRHIPLHVRKKMKDKPTPKYFEVEPSAGILLPNHTQDIRIKFMPSEEASYVDKIPFSIRQNSDAELYLDVSGRGSEPKIIFDRTLLEFDPQLPFSSGTIAEVTVSNPTPYPVEFYSLECDKQYTQDEEILQWLSECYDRQGRLFLPVFQPGETLPNEVIEAYNRDKEKKQVIDEIDSQLLLEAQDVVNSHVSIDQQQNVTSADRFVGTYELKVTQSSNTALQSTVPFELLTASESFSLIALATGIDLPTHSSAASSVVAAIARYLGIELTPEALAAHNRRGIAIVFHGPPSSGRTTQAKILADIYCGTTLNLDSVLIEAISSANTPVGIKAREFCIQQNATVETSEPPLQTVPVQNLSSRRQQQLKEQQLKEKELHLDSASNIIPPVPFSVNPLIGTEYAIPEGTLMPATLQEDIILDILSERLSQEDCNKGVIIDGIESQFTADSLTSMLLILKAFNNRKHIYCVHLGMDIDAINERLSNIEQARHQKIEEEEERKREEERREEERKKELLDLEEDEYEALPEKQQEEIDSIRYKRKKERHLKKKQEKEEQKRLAQEKKEEEERLKELERKKKGKGKQGHKLSMISKQHTMQAPTTLPNRPESIIHPQPSMILGPTNSGVSIGSGSILDSPNTITPRHKKQKSGKSSYPLVETDGEQRLEKAYNCYKSGLEGLKTLLDDWDRHKRAPRPRKSEEEQKPTPSRRNKGVKQREQEPSMSRLASPDVEEIREGLGIPFLDIKADESIVEVTKQMLTTGLPSAEEILEGMGLGPAGPPIPGPVLFQMYPFPMKRLPLDPLLEAYAFITASPDDPNGPPKEETEKLQEVEPEMIHEIKKPPSGSRISKRTSNNRPDTNRSMRRRGSTRAVASPQPSTTLVMPEEVQNKDDDKPIKLVKFRWVIPANGETTLKLLFKCNDRGQYDMTLNFEIAGTRRRYQLFCRGLCTTPSLCTEPRIVFPNRKKLVKEDEIVHKRFVYNTDTITGKISGIYHFGPLHCGKTRDRYKEGRYPENMESLTISNISQVVAEVQFYFLHDNNASTFLLDPQDMSLQPSESKTLNIWAYPKSADKFEDALVCCVKENPDPVIFKICTHGAIPDIKLDKKIIEFKKVLLHRKQTNVLHLHNKTMLPVAWKLSGLEQLGEEFSFSQDHGIVQPLTDFPLCVHFRSSKPVSYSKKVFKVEISDVEQIMGLMQTETVQIVAEAYDVAIDISFPRGTDGGLDFQCVKVCDEQKMVIQIKNRGKYDASYNFQINESLGPNGVNCAKLFHIHPSSSTLYPSDKPQSVAITFRANKEVQIKNLPILKCQVVDIHLSEQGEVIANIPIRVSAKAVFSHHTICPIDDINCGTMAINTKKQCSFTIHNKGEFEFKYAINKQMSAEQQKHRNLSMAAMAAKTRVKSRERLNSARSNFGIKNPVKRTEGPLRTEVHTGTQKLVLGMFSINPAFGSVSPGQTQVISVDCIADKAGKFEELLAIEISDQQKDTPPENYKICGEVMVPGINITDVGSIFEEHRVCRELGVLGHRLLNVDEDCVGVYGEEERRFVFKSVIVGQTAKARFKISNPNRIQCDVLISTRALSGRSRFGSDQAFEVEPSSKMSIMPHSFIYAIVTFRPSAIQTYSATFESIPDGSKGKGLVFELQGEGNLPQVSVIRPTLRNSKGHHCLLFQRLSTNHSQTLPLTFKNIGTIPSTVQLEVTTGAHVFQLPSPLEDVPTAGDTKGELSSTLLPPTTLHLAAGETGNCLVKFCPQAIEKYKGELLVVIKDNMFERFPVQLVGEGYEDDISIDNIRGQLDEWKEDVEEVSEDIEAHQVTKIHFGKLAVGENRQVTFQLTNLSNTTTLRFQWSSSNLPLTFTPSIGHIKPSSSKDITITFKSNKPQSLSAQKVVGKISRIILSESGSDVPDWDDSMKSVQWVNVVQPTSSVLENTSNNSIPTSSISGGSRPTNHSSSSTTRPPPVSAVKKKVIETEREPIYSEISNSQRDVELLVTGLVDYTKYECPINEISFRDTLMYQTRVYSFPLKNTSKIDLRYHWSILNKDRCSLPMNTSPHNYLDDNPSIASEGGETTPFSISPSSGVILPDREAIITVRFSPLDLNKALSILQCHIPYLNSSCSPLELPVEGKSLMPYCHFELEPSHHRSESSVANSSDLASARVVEFEPCGVGLVSVRKFHAINPMNSGYEFVWSTNDTSLLEPFRCLTQKGTIDPGKKYEMVFEYRPNTLEVKEVLWNFSIPSLSISNSFLLVGHTLDPSVIFDRAYLYFKPILTGFNAKETVYLINTEEKEYNFSFVEQSLYSEGYTGQLKLNPMSGVIPPNSKLPVDISFTSSQENDYGFKLLCKIKRKVSPLMLKVKAETYSIDVGLLYSSPDGTKLELPMGRSEKRVIDFGRIPIHDKVMGQLSVINRSLFSFEYHWKIMHQSRKVGVVSIEPQTGEIGAGKREIAELQYTPTTKVELKNCQLVLEIVNGPRLSIALNGCGVDPAFTFSFEECDFGPCILYHMDMPAQQKTLYITNTGDKELNIHCDFKLLPHLSLKFESCLLSSGQTAEATFEFRPQDTISYSETVTFEVNGYYQKSIIIKGQGTRMKLELANPAQKIVKFGALWIGLEGRVQSSKTVVLVNRSPTPLSPSLSIIPSSSIPALQEEGVLTVHPVGNIPLKANGGSCDVTVTFSPTCRVPQFSEEVTLECLGTSKPLFVVTGSCQSLEISIDPDFVPFGTVVQDSSSSRKLLMINSGDIGAAFCWETRGFGPNFSISPKEGYISSGMQVAFDVMFHPHEISQDIRVTNLCCLVEGRKDPLKLTLNGTCIEKTPYKDVLNFSTYVRSKETRNLTIQNKTLSKWVLHPVINGVQWSGPDTLIIEPNQSRHYELTYHPLEMTCENHKHHGSIFFPQPDGTGLLYHLQGNADPPKQVATITQEIPCKTSHTELLSVENWLRRPQRFTVTIDHSKSSDRSERSDRSVSLSGLNYIDVPALGKKDYQLHFYSFKECTVQSKVIFKNEQSGEYLFYQVVFKSTPPGIVATIDLTSQVRKSVSHVITILNPLPTPVTITTNCNVPDITLPSSYIIGAHSEGQCMFEYLPLKVGETTGKLLLQCSELGGYQYELRLTATACPHEKPVHFTANLGSNQQHTCRFISYTRGRTEYTCKVDNNDFSVEKNITVASSGGSGTEAIVEVTFEPSRLGDTQSTLSISSSTGGDYFIPLFGHCLPPKPQGPYVIRPGHSIGIPFKNIFHHLMHFKYSVDNPLFVVKPGDTIKARKYNTINVSYDAKQTDSPGVVKTGKLTVTNTHPKKGSASYSGRSHEETSWIFYIRSGGGHPSSSN